MYFFCESANLATIGPGGHAKLAHNILMGRQRSKHKTGSNERLFILTRTHSVHIFGEIPF